MLTSGGLKGRSVLTRRRIRRAEILKIRRRERSPWPLYWLQDGESSAHTSGGEEGAGKPRPSLRPLDAAPGARGSRALRAAPYPPRPRERISRDRRAGRAVAVHAGGCRGISGGPDRSPLRRP